MQFRMSSEEIKDFSVMFFEGITAEFLLRTGVLQMHQIFMWLQRVCEPHPTFFCPKVDKTGK